MDNIGKSVVKRDHEEKASGTAKYVADFSMEEVLHGKFLRSTVPHAKIKNIILPEIPDGYIVVDKDDVPGENKIHIVLEDMPVFAIDTVEYIGDPILMIVGPDEKKVEEIISQIVVDYEELPAVLDVTKSEVTFFEYQHEKGNIEAAFENADKVYDEILKTGYQEQVYLETNGMIADYHDGKITVRGSMQCPYYVHTALQLATGLDGEKVQVKGDVTGGGFGGKEDYPSILACQVAVASMKAKKPVRVIFDRREDITVTSKRHPSIARYRAAVKNGKITAMDIDIMYDAGAYSTLSAVVLQRGVICANGPYHIENLRVHGKASKTNTVPKGAFRGFGAPQVFFDIELFMNHIAKEEKRDILEFKKQHLAKQGDPTSTNGKYHFPVPLPEMIEEVDALCDYRKKKALYEKEQTGRFRRGIGLALAFHGAGFTGSGERDLIKAVLKLKKYKDGTVEILCSNIDMGQGLKTTLSKIAGKELGIPFEEIVIKDPDTDRVPDSGPTVASRSLMIVGELVRRAATRLKSQWEDGVEQIFEERYKEPDFLIPFSLDEFRGDAYPTYSWSVQAIELEIDMLTGQHHILGAYGSFDVGTPIDENIVVGQMEGGMLQGIGYSSMEYMDHDNSGRIRNNSLSNYIIPTAMDVPNMKVCLHVAEYPDGPYGAKGAGELPAVGTAAAYIEAVEQALGNKIDHIPFTVEDTMKVISTKKEGR
ncbi:xanthine dehydrogenase family protein molybdopterin-binding subunit [Garciella nitratireducens]|uniref:CO or xanthine dehydrogenase, Mo-binding subunit n=1 Tax=Garciella nitratireducens DSM 15102 TaxID=1121911 RepID=A0A1T4MPK0_9FIRM|nr:xanthine dehydrogenase family protein molybdopterin-binding subunit [Garciella nitratireducens]SJZ68969.1 CO or xanthine dehydrogenase, Mo-binding subunit [Garciella nitratireducens DSM 15102]